MTQSSPFWLLTDPGEEASYAEWIETEVHVETVICKVNAAHQAGGRRSTDLSVQLPRRVGDFIWTWMSECLIQEHVLKLFRQEGFSGYEVRKAMAVWGQSTALQVPRVSELVVTGWGGLAAEHSGVKLLEQCPGCLRQVYSCFSHPEALIDRRQWDGSDFFMVWPLPRFIFVTDRVVRVLKENRITGWRAQAPASMKCSSGKLSPGRLSWFMPEDRARALCEGLGCSSK